MLSLVDVLLQSEQFNGHFQTELSSIKNSDALTLVKELEDYFMKPCELRIYADGSGSIYVPDFWSNGENGHHVDRLIVSFGVIVMDTVSCDTEEDDACICKGNWRSLVKECEGLYGANFKDDSGRVLSFYGLVHTDEDYYYGFINKKGKNEMFSCVGDFETWGLTRLEKK